MSTTHTHSQEHQDFFLLEKFSPFSLSIPHKTGRDDWTILKKEEAEAKIYFRL